MDEADGVAEGVIGFGRKTADKVGAESGLGALLANPLAERDDIFAGVAAAHALENQIVAGLYRKVKMRVDSRILPDKVDEVIIKSGRV